MQLPPFGRLVKESLTLPKSAAARLLRMPVEFGTAVTALLLAVIVGTLLAEFMRVLLPGAMGGMQDALLSQPLFAVGLQFGLLLVMAGAAAAIGRAFGGTGTLPQATLLIAWLQTMMVLIQLLQLVLLLLIAPLALIVGVASVLWFFWALSVFVATLHGFSNVLKVFGMILISLLAILFAFGILLSLLGVSMLELA